MQFMHHFPSFLPKDSVCPEGHIFLIFTKSLCKCGGVPGDRREKPNKAPASLMDGLFL